jgi:hypothetical protein
MLFKKKPVVIEATQWFKNGDHPLDYTATVEGFQDGELVQFSQDYQMNMDWEGQIVRHYRAPGVKGKNACKHCEKIMHVHGWIDTLEGGHIVCPGDWIITGVKGEQYPCKNDVFQATYDAM